MKNMVFIRIIRIIGLSSNKSTQKHLYMAFVKSSKNSLYYNHQKETNRPSLFFSRGIVRSVERCIVRDFTKFDCFGFRHSCFLKKRSRNYIIAKPFAVLSYDKTMLS